jgi:ABC-type lipoprotein export system ATPase subunit
MPDAIIKTKHMDITYNLGKENEFKANSDINIDIYNEECIAFFGPSGCGKSTMLYCILGVLAPSAGELLVKGRNPYNFSPEEMVRFQTTTIGIIYQAFYLINSLSIADNVALPQIFQGVSPSKRRKWAMHLLKRFDIDNKADVYPENLSGGQSQRVSVARAIVNNPDILLADEPTGNLDSVSTKQVISALEEINAKDKKTVIIITHNAAQLAIAHRVFYMNDGKILRTVPNPEKKQIAKIDKQKMFVTEMEQLSKIYPYLTQTDLKVKSMVNYLTQDLTYDQIIRLEDAVKIMIEGKIEKENFVKLITGRLNEGGANIQNNLANAMAEKIAKILKQSEDVNRYRRRFEQNMFYNKEDVLLRRLTGYLIDEMPGKIDLIQHRKLKNLVYARIGGLIPKEEFLAQLSAPAAEGGVGLSFILADKITRYYEKIMTQGVAIADAGH